MKKYLLILAAVMMTAVSLSSCLDPEPPKPEPEPTEDLKIVNSAIYFGQKMGDAAGFFSFTAQNTKGDIKIKLDCYSTLVPNPNLANIVGGDYKFSTKDDVASRKFFGAETTESEYGSMFWENDVPYVVTGGEFNVVSVGGLYTIKFTLKSGEKEIKGTFKNTIKFDNKFSYAPRKEGVRKAEKAAGRYYGNTSDSSLKTGLFVIDLLSEGELSKKAVALEIMGYMPLHTTPSADNQRIPAGTYTIKEKNTGELNSLVAGEIVKSAEDADGTVEFSSGVNGKFEFGWIIKEGTMVVEYTSGNNCKITATMKGNRVNKTEILNENLETVEYVYEGVMPALQNNADPMSNIPEGGIDLGTEMNKGILNIGTSEVGGVKFNMRELFLFGKDLNYSINSNNVLSITGKGHYVLLSLWDNTVAATEAPEFISGDFKMAPKLGVVTPGGQTAMPGIPGVPENMNPSNGTWYAYYNVDEKFMDPVGGAIPAVGGVKTSENANNYIFEIEFSDKSGNIVKGTATIPKVNMKIIKNG